MRDNWTDNIKARMDGYEERPSRDLWAGIDKAMGAKSAKKSRTLPIIIWSGSIAACLALVFLVTRNQNSISGVESLLGMSDGDEDIAVVEKPVEDTWTLHSLAENAGASKEEADETTGIEAVAASQAKRIAMADSGPEGLSVEGPNTECSVRAKSAGDNKESANTVVAEADEDETAEASTISQSNDSKADAASSGAEKAGPEHSWVEKDGENWSAYEDLDSDRTAREGKWSAALGVKGAGSRSSSEVRDNVFAMGSNPLENSTVESTNWADGNLNGMVSFNSPETEMSYRHKQPVRLGVTVRYNFNKTLGLESGLSYTILSSDINGSSNGDKVNEATQTLHYIGIPLNLSCNLYSNRYINVYAIGGGMGEKCVSGRVKSTFVPSDSAPYSTSKSICPKDISWSVNAAAGLQVNILKNLGIYVEPGVSHHFDKTKGYRTIYTDKPTTFSLAFGLRVGFGK